MKVIVFFVEITEYNLARIYNVYERFSDIQFDYVYYSESVSGHTTNRKLPENAIVLSGSYSDKKAVVKRLIKQNDYGFAIINGYSDRINSYTIFHCRKRGIPYAIETDTQLNVPATKIKAVIKSLYLKKVFSGNAYGFAGGTRQKELFYYYGMDPDHVYLMPMTVDVDYFKNRINELPSKDELKEKHGLFDKKVVLYVGRFAEEKDISTLILAMAVVCRKHSNAHLCLIGKGDEKEHLMDLVKQKSMKESVSFLDYMTAEQLTEYYKLADVFVLPSTFEPWGLVVNEALACGLPVVASDKVGAVDDLIICDQNGDEFPSGDSRCLAEMIGKWLYNKYGIVGDSIMDEWNHSNYFSKLNRFFTEQIYLRKQL